jgi:hypothetical protein
VDNLDPGVIQARLFHAGANLFFASDEVYFTDGGVGLERKASAFDDNPRPVIPAHHIHNHSHKGKSAKE